MTATTLHIQIRERPWINLGLLALGGFIVLVLMVGQVHVDWGILRFSCTGIGWPLGMLFALYAAKCIRTVKKGMPARNVLRADAPFLLFLFGCICFLSPATKVIPANRPFEKQSIFLTGDEPSYMLLTQSIVLDGDVNLWNDVFERGGDLFGLPKAGPHKAFMDKETEQIYSIHSPGLPILLAPFFSLAMKTGMPPRYVCAMTLALLSAGLVVLTFVLGTRLSGSRPAAFCTAGMMAATCPLLIYSYQIYPELPAAFFTVMAFSCLQTGDPKSRTRLFGALGAGVAMAFLPWLHIRYALFSAGILAGLFSLHFKDRAYLATALLPPAVSAAVLMGCYNRWYGSPWPNAAYKAQGSSAISGEGLMNLPANLLGVFFDSGNGLLTWSPCFALVPAGVWFAWKSNSRMTRVTLGMVLAYLLLIASFEAWWGGFAPPARFLVVIIPFFSIWIASLLALNPKRILVILFAILFTASGFLIHRAVFVGRYSKLYSKYHILVTSPIPNGLWMARHIRPSLLRKEPHAAARAYFHLGILCLLNFYAVLPSGRSIHTVNSYRKKSRREATE